MSTTCARHVSGCVSTQARKATSSPGGTDSSGCRSGFSDKRHGHDFGRMGLLVIAQSRITTHGWRSAVETKALSQQFIAFPDQAVFVFQQTRASLAECREGVIMDHKRVCPPGIAAASRAAVKEADTAGEQGFRSPRNGKKFILYILSTGYYRYTDIAFSHSYLRTARFHQHVPEGACCKGRRRAVRHRDRGPDATERPRTQGPRLDFRGRREFDLFRLAARRSGSA